MEALKKGLKDFSIEPTENLLQQFCTYEKMLADWNSRMNLTAITSHNEVISKHFVDSVACQGLIPTKARVADVGTGAGFPGLPLAMVRPDIAVTLMDALAKRISFLDAVIQELKIENVDTVHIRAEDAGQDKAHREQYDVVCARAVANLSVLSEYCLPLVKPGGIFLALKGREAAEEAKNAEKAIKILGGSVLEIREVFWENLEHRVVMIQKKQHTPAPYPRKAGKPQKSPLS